MKKDISNVKLYTGVPEIDNLTKGLKQGLHVISGFRKCCKSTFAINMIYRALNDGLNVCLLSLEMSKMEIINILLSLHSYECDSLTAINRDELLMLYELDRDKYNDYLFSFLSLKGNLFIITEKEIEAKSYKSIYCEETLDNVMNREKPNQILQFKIKEEKLFKVIPKNIERDKVEDFVLKACEYYSKHIRQKERDSR